MKCQMEHPQKLTYGYLTEDSEWNRVLNWNGKIKVGGNLFLFSGFNQFRKL